MPMPILTTNGVRTIKALSLDPNATTEGYKKSHPVFLVTLTDGGQVVLKAETRGSRGMVSDHAARWAGKMMYQVSDYTKVNLLTQTEAQSLRLVPEGRFEPLPRRVLAHSYLVDLLNCRNFGFYKMPYVDNMQNADDMLKNGRGLELLAKLRDDRNVLLNLAKIVAVDLFTGNHDRFTETGAIANSSNILFQEGNNTLTPIGVDFYFFESESSNLFSDPPPMWPGLVLQSQQTLRIFAERMVAGLNRFFKESIPNLPDDQLIRMMSVGTVTNGLVSGAQDLRNYLQGRIRGGKKVPSGVMKRMVLLKWA